MKLTDALAGVRRALGADGEQCPDVGVFCPCLYCASARLVAAVEARLDAELRQAREIVGLMDLHQHGGGE